MGTPPIDAEAASEIDRPEHRLRVLSVALRAFAEATTDYDRLLEVVARTLSDVVADGCIVRLLADDGLLAPAALCLPIESRVDDPGEAARLRSVLTTPQRISDYAWGVRLMETGEAFLASPLDRTALTTEIAEVYDRIGVHSLLVTALRVRGESIGTLAMFRFRGASPPFDTRDQELAQALADHAALAIANARSYAAERAARDAAEKAKARFARLNEAGVIGTVVVDLVDRAVVDINDALLDLLGYSRDDFLAGRIVWRSLTPPEWRDLDNRAVDQLATTGVAGLREKEYFRKDGTRIPVLAGSAMLRDGTEQCISFVLDLTERKEAERGRREAERRSQRIVESSMVGIWMIDIDGQTTFMNARMAAILGIDVSDGARAQFADFFLPEDLLAIRERLAQRSAGVSSSYETRFRRRDGSVGLLAIEASPMYDARGGYEGVLGMVSDVTQRLRLEEQLRQSQKMEAIGKLAGGVAHDFNNLLSVILSYAEMLLAEVKPGEPIRDDIDEMRKAGERAADLTRQLLMFSRQQVLAPKVLDLNEVLTSMNKMLERILGADVDLVSLPASPLGRVRADPSSLEQVIMNLVVNARDAMPTGGKLTMETGNVVLDEAFADTHLGVSPGPHVMLAVTDSGIGMDPSTLSRIFEPFFTTKESGKGTGLGLSTVFGIIKQSGGSVWVYSEKGRGTTVKVYLPRVDGAIESVRVTAAQRSLRGNETILLVEDDDQVRAVARGILLKNGYHVIEARNAGEALLHSEKHPTTIHLLLSDVVMPQMSGPELAKRLAKSRPEMKVLCMSGYTDDSIVRHGVLEAQVAFLQKPFTPDMLARRVREVIEGAQNGTG
jgi:two-component system, cell cycle sensor histidine kinase and response regulator CckA